MNNSENNLLIRIDQNKINNSLLSFVSKRSEIESIVASAFGLKIEGIEDKKGYALVSAKRKELKAQRIEIEKQAKEIRRIFDSAKKTVIEKEKLLLDIVAPIEDGLYQQEKAIDAENERIKQEKEHEQERLIQSRVDSFLSLGFNISGLEVKYMTDSEYETRLAACKEAHDVKLAEQEAERLRQEKEKEELLQRQREAEEQNRLLKADNEKLMLKMKSIEESQTHTAQPQPDTLEAEALSNGKESESKSISAAPIGLDEQCSTEETAQDTTIVLEFSAEQHELVKSAFLPYVKKNEPTLAENMNHMFHAVAGDKNKMLAQERIALQSYLIKYLLKVANKLIEVESKERK